MSLSLYLFFPQNNTFFYSGEFFCMYLFSQLTPFSSAGCFLLPRFLSRGSRRGLCRCGGQTLFGVDRLCGGLCCWGALSLRRGAGVVVVLGLC